MKVCPVCKQLKVFDEFYLSNKGTRSYCKVCCKNQSRKWKRDHPDLIKERSDRYRAKNYYRLLNSKREKSWKHQGVILTVEKYNKICAQQNNRCAICNADFSLFKKFPHVDHDHKNGRVRGLLCGFCNSHIVKVVEDFQHLIPLATKYLATIQPLD